jgi:hypothetical protein
MVLMHASAFTCMSYFRCRELSPGRLVEHLIVIPYRRSQEFLAGYASLGIWVGVTALWKRSGSHARPKAVQEADAGGVAPSARGVGV